MARKQRVFWLDLLSDGTVREPVVAPDEVRGVDAFGGDCHLIYDAKTDTVFTATGHYVFSPLVVRETLDQYRQGEL